MESSAVTARGITKRVGDVVALDEMDLDVAAGQVHGLVGPNGAGKTTLLGLLLGLAVADRGRLEILGPAGWRRCCLGLPGHAARRCERYSASASPTSACSARCWTAVSVSISSAPQSTSSALRSLCSASASRSSASRSRRLVARSRRSAARSRESACPSRWSASGSERPRCARSAAARARAWAARSRSSAACSGCCHCSAATALRRRAATRCCCARSRARPYGCTVGVHVRRIQFTSRPVAFTQFEVGHG